MKEAEPTPTAEGIKRFPPDGYYKDGDDREWWEPCTCKRECPTNCKGECSCPAHHTAYQDYLSSPMSSI